MSGQRPRQPFLREVADQLYTNNIPTIAVGIVIAILLSLLHWQEAGGSVLLAVWLAAVLAVYVGRYVLARVYFKSPSRGSEHWLNRFRATAALQGVLWGLSAFVLFPGPHPLSDIAFLFSITGVSAGAAIAFGIDMASVLVFVVPLITLLLTRLFTLGGADYAAIGVVLLLFLGYVAIGLPRSAAASRENLRLRLEAARREEEIRERNTLLDGILDNEPACVKVIAPDGTLQMMNKAGLAMLEVASLEEVNRIGLLNFVHPDHRDAFQHLAETVFEGASGQLEFQVIGKRGTLRWLETSATPLRNAAGEVNGLLGVTRNVTARRRARENLQRSEQRFRLLSAATFEGVVLAAEGRVVDANEQLAQMLGYTREALIGRPVTDFVAPEYAAAVQANIDSGAARTGEYPLLRRDGTHIMVEVHTQTSHEDGMPLWMAAMRDITASKQAALELQKSEQRYRMLSSGTFEGVVLVAHGCIVDLNEQLAQMLGHTREQMLSRPMVEFLVEADRPRVLAAIDSREERRGEYTMLHADGHRVVVEAHGQSYEQDGQMMRLTAVRDVTERKQHEARLRENRQLLDSIVEHIPNMIFLKDAQTLKYVMLNAAVEKLLGHTRAEMLDKTDYDFFPKEQADFFSANDRAVLAAPPDEDPLDITEEAVPTPAGIRIMHTQTLRLRGEDGTPRYLLGIAEDITERKHAERALRESEEKLRSLYELAPLGISLTDLAGRYVEFNEAFLTLCGHTEDEVRNLDYWTLTPKQYQAEESKQLESLRTTGSYGPYEKEYIRKDGSRVPVRTNGVLVSGRDGHQYVWSIIEDISASRQAEREVRIAATAFESQEGMIITDENARILRVNKAFTDITGYPREEVEGKNPSMLSSGRHDKRFYETMWDEIRKTGSWAGEVWNRRKDGELFPEHLTITSVKDADGKVMNYVGTLIDITQRKASEEEIQRLAFYDHLTTLPNRRLFMDRLTQSIAGGARTSRVGALLFIDLDNFKNLNDSLGHDYGDMLLQQIARRLQSCVRQGDTVARLGGDEFVVLLEDVSHSIGSAVTLVEGVARKVLETLDRPYNLNGVHYSSTPSIGVTLIAGHDPDPEALLKQADVAMYEAKKSGRNTVRFFDRYMQDALTRRAELEHDLRGALAHGEISLVFQVQVTSQRKPVGAEALARWHHPQRGMVSPAEFIPLAEETGLIEALGQTTIDKACAQLKAWDDNPRARELSLAVNVGARQFRHAGFAAEVAQTIRRHGIRPGRLKLELTETTVLQNIEEAVRTVTALNEVGVQIAIDDFGTGYSSLQYLKRLPLDQIKIDPSFVRDLGQNRGALAIVQTIIAMADGLGLDVIAQGVETEDQFEVLHRSGCSHFQGYLFGTPMPLADFEAALITGN